MDSTIILITGANTGLGLETVKALLESPKCYTILLGSRSMDKADAAVQQLQAEFPNSATVVTPVQVDIEDDQSIEKAFDHVADQYGRVDVLINNAGRCCNCVSFQERHLAHTRFLQEDNSTPKCIPAT